VTFTVVQLVVNSVKTPESLVSTAEGAEVMEGSSALGSEADAEGSEEEDSVGMAEDEEAASDAEALALALTD
jgi:hypothetical protein